MSFSFTGKFSFPLRRPVRRSRAPSQRGRSSDLEGGLEHESGLEPDGFHRADFHRLAGVRIVAAPRRARRDVKGAESDQLHRAVAPESLAHGREHGVDGALRRGLRSFAAETVLHFIDQFSFVHGWGGAPAAGPNEGTPPHAAQSHFSRRAGTVCHCEESHSGGMTTVSAIAHRATAEAIQLDRQAQGPEPVEGLDRPSPFAKTTAGKLPGDLSSEALAKEEAGLAMTRQSVPLPQPRGPVAGGSSGGTSPLRPFTTTFNRCASAASRVRPRSTASCAARFCSCAAIVTACAGLAPSRSHSARSCSSSLMAHPSDG